MIATVAAVTTATAFAGALPQKAKSGSPRAAAARVERLIRKNLAHAEIIRVPGLPAVRLVRGKSEPPAVRGTDEAVTFADGKSAPVHVLRGLPMVAAVSIAAPARSGGAWARVAVQVVSFSSRLGGPVTVLRGPSRLVVALPAVAQNPDLGLFAAAPAGDLDRVAFAVDGAESSHGADPGMWRAELAGPQGPMQVSAAAAADTGGGDRFDLAQNRLLGRAYLARLYRRYGNWPDAVAAYNWGPGNLDSWIAEGRPAAALPLAVAHYRDRVLHDGGIGLGALLTSAAQPVPAP